MTRWNKSIGMVALCLAVLAVIPEVYAAPVVHVTTVDWTYIAAFGGGRWLACVNVDGRAAGYLGYTFQYGSYTRAGTLDGGGCFELAQQNVGSTFGFGSTYTLTAGNSPSRTLKVSTARTLGGTILAFNVLSLIIPVLALLAMVAAGIVLGVGFYIVRRRQPTIN